MIPLFSIETPFPTLFPETFFSYSFGIKNTKSPKTIRKKRAFLIPQTQFLFDEESFADFYMGWSMEGLSFFCDVHTPFKESCYPQFNEGDSLELWIDTRKPKGMFKLHKFCHHFLLLPTLVQGVQSIELSKFHRDDGHPLAPLNEAVVMTIMKNTSYSMEIFLPKEILYGYAPDELSTLGFSYRLHRKHGPPQHFSLSSGAAKIEKNPALWATVLCEI